MLSLTLYVISIKFLLEMSMLYKTKWRIEYMITEDDSN